MNTATLILDTNILIYYLNNQGGETFLACFADTLRAGAGVSVITRIEVLGWRGHTADSIRESTSLLGLCVDYPLSEPVISEANLCAKSVAMNSHKMISSTGKDIQRL